MTFKHIITPSLLALSLSLVACNNAATDIDNNRVTAETSHNETAKVTTVAEAKPTLGTYGIATEHMDKSVKPGDNFFEYVNGTWLANTEIPADRARYGSFNVLADEAEERVKAIIEAAASKSNPSSDEKRIGDLFAAYTNTSAIEAAGMAPIKEDLARIRSAKTLDDIARLMADAELSLDAPMSQFIGIDAKDNENYTVYLGQSGLGLPNRDYYFDESEKGQEILTAYIDYLGTLLTEAGQDNVKSRAQAVMDFETALAKNYWTRVQMRDRDRTYNKMSRAELIELTKGMPTQLMLDQIGLSQQENFIVRTPEPLKAASKVFASADMDVLRDYLTVSLLSNNAGLLPKRIDEAQFAFYGKALRGQEQQRERWKRGVQQVNGLMGELVGKVYVDQHFPPDSKRQMQELVENLRAAFKDGIDGLEWMGEETKKQAQYKLAQFRPKIGYPDRWEKYDGLSVDRDDVMKTFKSARKWSVKDELSKLGGPIDRDEWGMTPQTVNAYYNPTLNEIVFPAAILQAPFFDPAADPAVNYGGIGAVIGHEMGHGFDDQGRKSDGDGLQRDWWTTKDAEAYEERAGLLADQYSAFEPLPGEPINGRLSLGENIGDLTGVTMAYEAYKRSLGGKPAPVIDGMTGDQRFFMAWAQVWAIKWREEALRAQIKNGPHSPGEFRANGIVRNIDAWYEAFNVQPGDAMYLPPEKRVKIW